MSQSGTDDQEVESFILDEKELDAMSQSVLASELAVVALSKKAESIEVLDGEDSIDEECISVDPETQSRLEALLEAAGIGKLSTSDGKAFADPEVLRRLTSSVSCALDEAAAALSRMRAETDAQNNQRTLAEACSDGDIIAVRRLLDEGKSIHETTEEGESLLSLACSAGYYELVEVLLSMQANIEDRGPKGECTPLMEAASGGFQSIVELLVSHGADVNATSNTGNTALTFACCGGYTEVVKILLAAGADLEVHNENGHTPLMEAASSGHTDVAAILLHQGAGINTHSNEFKESALTLACYKGHLEMVRFLLNAGADQEHKTDEMHTALMEASMDGHVDVARLLLDSGAQVNMPADSFESPLTLAACGGHVELASLLLERGAKIEEVNDEGYTPLMEASREGHEEMVAILIAHGAKINVETEETQETALTLACCGGFLECCELLIQAGADLELGCSTPLMEAAQEGQVEVVKFLLQRGAKVNAQTSSGDTALSYACDHGHTDVADLLLAAGAELDHESEGGRTPLMKAARAGHLCTVQFLISRGADVNKRTKNNDHTVLSLACVYGHLPVVELLLCQGADPTHKLKDGSTMLLEAAKGGHTAVVQMLLDFPYNFLASSMSPSNMQVTPPISEQCTPRVPTHALPMIVPPQEPDKTPSGVYNFSDIMTGNITPNMQSEASDNVPECHMESNHCDHNLCPRKPTKFIHQITEENLNQGTMHHPSPYKPCTLSPMHLNPSLNSSNDSLSQLSLQELNCLSELEQRIKKAIEKNAHLKSLEGVQTEKEKVEDMYKNQEEQIVKKQKILEELQKVERELQLKTHQQLRNNYFSNPSIVPDDEVYDGSSRGKADGQDSAPEEAAPATLEISVATRQGENTIQNTKTEEFIVGTPKNFNYPSSPEQNPPEGFSCDQSCNNPYVICPSTPIQLVDTTKLKVTATQSPTGEKFPATNLANDEIPQIPTSPYQSTVIDCCTESNHDTPLTLACAGGHEELVDLLISRGANIEHRDKKGFTPLILAATAGHADVVSILLDANADIESQSERTKDTPLSLACSGGRLEVVEVLLSRGAAKEHRNVSDYTPLSLAASGGYVNIIRVLLRAGAEINSRTGSKLGISPLMLAAMNGHTQAVQLLLDQGADINAQIETNQNTALTLACFQGRHEVVSLLVDRRANIEHRAKTGLTPLMEAASGGYAEVGRVLLQKCADVNAAPVPSSRDTALTIAADKGHYRFCDLLLKHWAIVDVRNKKGNTPFWLACNGGHLDVAQLLLSKGANPSAADNRGIMPLMAAFRKGHLKVTRWLVREVSQFPSDSECMRYIATISDRDLLKRCRMCMECIATAKDKQAQEANKYASELLEELDMEKSREENRKERAARKREKRRLKRKQKQQIISKDGELTMNEIKEALPEKEESQYPELYSYKEEKTVKVVPEKRKDNISQLNPTPSSTSTLASTEEDNKTKEIQENIIQGKENVCIEKSTENTKNVGNHPTHKIYQKKKTRTEQSSPDAMPTLSRVPVLHSENISTSPVSSVEVSAPHHQTTPSSKRTFRQKVVGKTFSREFGTPKPKSYSLTQPISKSNSSKKVQQKEEGWKEVVRKSKRVIVASNLISRVIGRGGCNINAIRQVTGAHIDIDKQKKGGHERTITIRGATESIRHAHLLICELIKDDNSDQNINTIIKKVEIETLATTKAPSAKTSSAVVEAPLPTRPAWKVPLSDISNPIRSNVKIVVTQAQRSAISTSTSFPATTSAKDFSAIQANAVTTNSSTNIASRNSGSTVTFTSKTSDRYSNRPVQPVAPMISLKSTPVKYAADVSTHLITGPIVDSSDLLQTIQNGNNVPSAVRGSDISNLAVGQPIISSGGNMNHSNPAAFQSDVRAINLMSNFQSSNNSKMSITESVPSPIASTVVGRNLASDMSLYNSNFQHKQADAIGSDRKIWPIGTERARSHRRSAFVQPSSHVESPGMWTFIEPPSSAIGDGNYRSFGSNVKNQNTPPISGVMSSAPIGPPSLDKYSVPKSADTGQISDTNKMAYVCSPDMQPMDGKVLYCPQPMVQHALIPNVQPPIGGHLSGPGVHEQGFNHSGQLMQQHSTITQPNMNDQLKPYLQHSDMHDFGGGGKWHQRFMSVPAQHSVMQKNHLLPKNAFEPHRFTQPIKEELYYNIRHQSYHQLPYDMQPGANDHVRNAMSEFFPERGSFVAQQEAMYSGNDKYGRSIGDGFAHARDRDKSIGNAGHFIVDHSNLTPENMWEMQERQPVHPNVIYDSYNHKVFSMNGEEADTPIMSGTGGVVGYPLPDEMHRGHL